MGFTLIEVLVALGIVAVALAAGFQSASMLANSSLRQSDTLLAGICADNEFIKLRLYRQLPNVGDTTMACDQGGQLLYVTLSVQPTANPDFRRVEATVRDESKPLLRLTTVATRY